MGSVSTVSAQQTSLQSPANQQLTQILDAALAYLRRVNGSTTAPGHYRCLEAVQNILQQNRLPGARVPRLPEARDFAQFLNSHNPADYGLMRINITNPTQAPPGAILVFRGDAPGLNGSINNPGDIAIRGGTTPDGVSHFYNDGHLSYPNKDFPAGTILGAYVPIGTDLSNIPNAKDVPAQTDYGSGATGAGFTSSNSFVPGSADAASQLVGGGLLAKGLAEIENELKALNWNSGDQDNETLAELILTHPELRNALENNPPLLARLANDPSLVEKMKKKGVRQVLAALPTGALNAKDTFEAGKPAGPALVLAPPVPQPALGPVNPDLASEVRKQRTAFAASS